MTHEFEVREEIELPGTPEEVWEAITSGPGLDSWYMGRSEIEPREGGRTRLTLPGMTAAGTVTGWEPGTRFATRGDERPDGGFMAFEYLIEGRAGGSTILRFVHNGFLGDDWEDEYDALSVGDLMYLYKLRAYLRHFRGRTSAYNIFVPGPQVPDRERVWATFRDAFCLTGGELAEGDAARLSVAGLPPAEGAVEFISPAGLGVRTTTGLYTLIYGYRDTVVVSYHAFDPDAGAEDAERAWQSWLTGSFA